MKAKMLDAMKGVGKVASEVYNRYWKGEEVHREDQSPIVSAALNNIHGYIIVFITT